MRVLFVIAAIALLGCGRARTGARQYDYATYARDAGVSP